MNQASLIELFQNKLIISQKDAQYLLSLDRKNFKSDEEYNQAAVKTAEVKALLFETYIDLEKTFNEQVSMKDNLKDEAFFESCITAGNAVSDVKYKFYKLSDAEKRERYAIHEEAKGIYAKTIALNVFVDRVVSTQANHIAGVSVDNEAVNIPRAMYAFPAIGVKNPEDVLKNVSILVNGTKAEKEAFLEKSLLSAISTLKEACFLKTDKEYVEFFKNHSMDCLALGDLDGDKIHEIENTLKVKVPEYVLNELTKYSREASLAVNTFTRFGLMASPYYPITHPRNITNLFNLANAGYAENMSEAVGEDVFGLIYNKSKTAEEEKETGISRANPLYGIYRTDGFCSEESIKEETMDTLKEYVRKYKASFFVDKKGNAISTEDKNFYTKMANAMYAGEKFVAYTETQRFISLVDVNIEKSGLVNDHHQDLNISFLKNSKEAMETLITGVNNLAPAMVFNHKEFRNLRKEIENLPKMLKKDPFCLDSQLRKISNCAKAYLESKYDKNAPSKSALTYQREEFAMKVYNTIENHLDPRRFYEAPLKKPVDLEKDLNPKVLEKIIEKNHKSDYKEEITEFDFQEDVKDTLVK